MAREVGYHREDAHELAEYGGRKGDRYETWRGMMSRDVTEEGRGGGEEVEEEEEEGAGKVSNRKGMLGNGISPPHLSKSVH